MLSMSNDDMTCTRGTLSVWYSADCLYAACPARRAAATPPGVKWKRYLLRLTVSLVDEAMVMVTSLPCCARRVIVVGWLVD
jgi:hypothetical protein